MYDSASSSHAFDPAPEPVLDYVRRFCGSPSVEYLTTKVYSVKIQLAEVF